MGLSARQTIRIFLACALLAGGVCAAPRLRVTTTALGPFSVALGGTAPVQVVDAYNVGDGEIALDVQTSAPWVLVLLGEARECGRGSGVCYPIRIEATTAGLAKGRHTGVVTVRAPGALDAPQTITVTLDAGGSIPERIQLAVRPGAADSTTIRTSNPVGATASTETGGNWLSIPSQAVGSFRFSTSHTVEAKHLAGMANGDYAGQVTVSGSPVADENRSIPVQFKVTEGAICTPGVTRLDLRLAEGSGAYGQGIGVTNRGAGELILEAPAGSASWLSGEVIAGNAGVLLKVDPAGLGQGFYRGELEIRSNAANGPQKLEVGLEITPGVEPWMKPGSLSDRVTVEILDVIAPGMLLALKGEQFTTSGNAQAEAAPWPQELGGARILINGIPAAMEWVTPLEVRFQAPAELDGEEAVLEIERAGVKGNQILVQLRPAAPRVERVTFEDGGAITQERPARAGDSLLIVATGLGKSDPAVAAGAVGPEGSKVVETVTVSFGAGPFVPRVIVEAASAVPSPERPGRYLVRLPMPEGVPPANFVETRVVAGGSTSNAILIVAR